jgi:hypothetical protein
MQKLGRYFSHFEKKANMEGAESRIFKLKKTKKHTCREWIQYVMRVYFKTSIWPFLIYEKNNKMIRPHTKLRSL